MVVTWSQLMSYCLNCGSIVCVRVCVCVLLLVGEAGISLLSRGSDTLCDALNLLIHPHRVHRYAAGDPGSSGRTAGSWVGYPKYHGCTRHPCLVPQSNFLPWSMRHMLTPCVSVAVRPPQKQNALSHPRHHTHWNLEEYHSTTVSLCWGHSGRRKEICLILTHQNQWWAKFLTISEACRNPPHLSAWHWNVLRAFALVSVLWWSISQCA